MNMPGFGAPDSLYRTTQIFGSFGRSTTHAARGVVASQSPLCGNNCLAACGAAVGGCVAACVVAAAATGPFSPATLATCLALGCGGSGFTCFAECPPCASDPCAMKTNCHGTDTGFCFCNGELCGWGCWPAPPPPPPPPPPECCPPGMSCKCGGTCVAGRGCVGGQCLGPRESCN
jgi:hypothetical protein